MRATAPSREIHFRNSGALLSNQPVAPPSNRIGESVVPNPNRTARAKLSNGEENDTEYAKIANNGAHKMRPRDKPSRYAHKSKRSLNLELASFCTSEQPLHEGGLFRSRIVAPMAMVTMPNANEEYA